MASSKSDHLNLAYLPQLSAAQPRSGSSTTNTSPVESTSTNSLRSPFVNGLASAASTPGNVRLGAGSPSHEIGGGRLFSKRAREIQAQEGVTSNLWGPPTSGNSTPLRENIPESPTDGFPDFVVDTASAETSSQSSSRRARAGTVPSRFSPGGIPNGLKVPQSLLPKTSRPTPSTSPFKSNTPGQVENIELAASKSLLANSTLLSRLRSGSMPQRTNYVAPAGPFGPTLFSTNWSSVRDRATTLTSVMSAGSNTGPISPAQSSFSKDGVGDNEMRTLDYLGLVDSPQTPLLLHNPSLDALLEAHRSSTMPPFMTDLAGLNKAINNRYRSYSVNAKEKYAEDQDDELDQFNSPYNGSMTPSAVQAAAAVAVTQAQIHQHNLAVQAFANQASVNRPRARTAGVLESPPQRIIRNYLATPSRLDNSISASDLRLTDTRDYEGLPEAVQALGLGGLNSLGSNAAANMLIDENNLEGPTRSLWLGSIPSSTTVSSLDAIFNRYGSIASVRVLTHKNCGFVNFERLESAIQAKTLLNGKEIFPGAGPVRIGYAKPFSATGTPGPDDAFPSPSPDPFAKGQAEANPNTTLNTKRSNSALGARTAISRPASRAAAPVVPELRDLKSDMLSIVKDFGACDDDQARIARSIEAAINFESFAPEIPQISDPAYTRTHDAPKLRDIRKRIDNNACSQAEIEEIALEMLPEIAELSSDYLGNTVVQKLFEYCQEPVKESMLREIAPRLGEIGVHKNGTWAAQKIIDVAKTPNQMSTIVNSLHPYTVALFLDQYGNYVLQCCLRFGYPFNNFIFETMLSRMWDIAQGRFGARAMRACLESHHSTKDQQRMLAAAVALHSVQLATNANGALLLTWFLDTCTFPRRRTVLAPRLVPHLVHLCTHKVAFLTVLKVINQRNEPEARDIILKALFFSPNDEVLNDVLSDQACGPTLIFKVLTTPFFDESIRTDVVQNVRNVLVRLKAQPAQGYKRLMDEVGLSTRNGVGTPNSGRDHGNRESSSSHSPAQDGQRPSSQQHTPTSHPAHQQQAMGGQYNASYFTMPPQQFESNLGMPRTASMDTGASQAFEQFGLNGMGSPMFIPNGQISPMTQQMQQLQYHQALLAAQSQSRNIHPASFFPGVGVGLGGYGSPPSSMDTFRNNQSHVGLPPPQMSATPMMGQSGFGTSAFSPMMGAQMMSGSFQHPNINGLHYMAQPQQQQQSGGRRGGRVGAAF
ncbi:MAG: hypothetical protein M1829_001906 [Trizodia sp. TS-e1964]|nr:MAG: hypothetical protein M1829_001906 [Trizodia sp. TS-e1964]